jgi:hypothetical protein
LRIIRHGGADGRSRPARRWRDLYLGFTAELGNRKPTTSEDAQLRQAATLALRSEKLTTMAAAGGRIDSAELTSLCGELRRVLRTLGLGGASGSESDADQLRRRREDLEAGLR